MNNFTVGVQALHSTSIQEEPIYKQYNKPVAKELFPLPKPVLYLLIAALALVGVAYVIVGHLIKDLAVDLADCMLGPPEDSDKDRDNNLRHVAQSHPPPSLHLSHTNLFHQDDAVIPLPADQEDVVIPLPADQEDVVIPLPADQNRPLPAAMPLVFYLLSHPPRPKDSSLPLGLANGPGTVPEFSMPVVLKVGSGGVLEGVLGGPQVNHG